MAFRLFRFLAALPVVPLALAATPTQAATAEYAAISERLAPGVARLLAAGATPSDPMVLVDVTMQRLYVVSRGEVAGSWPVATGRGGVSARRGSGGTPAGVHRIGAELVAKRGEVFKSRRATGSIAAISNRSSGKASMTTALLTLDGQERSNSNTASRGIYIHGTNLEGSLGRPLSSGCVRMGNDAVMELTSLVGPGTWVYILR
jgi:lipoprotein-anchoring transpeptidase ErfK/SrfK